MQDASVVATLAEVLRATFTPATSSDEDKLLVACLTVSLSLFALLICMLVTPCILRAAEGVVNLFCELREKWMPADAEHNNLRVIKCTTFSLTNADGHLIVGNPPIITTSNPTGENWVQDYFNELKNTDPAERDKHFQGSFEPLTPIPDVQCLSGNHELIEVTLIGSPFRNFICRRCTKRTP